MKRNTGSFHNKEEDDIGSQRRGTFDHITMKRNMVSNDNKKVHGIR